LKLRLLIVEDDEHVQQALRRLAEGQGHKVLQAFDGLSALTLARVERPDVIVLDISLPFVDGRDVLSKLKADGATAAIPVLVYSARAEQTDRHVALQLGADDFVEKPCDAELLLRRVLRLVEQRNEK
jgi:DNA-binding response OmpR family regulator